MAWDNAPWPQPPNGAQYISAAGNWAKALADIVNGGFNAYQKGQEFQYQQQQRNLFQNPDNQAALQDAIKTGNYAPVLQSMIQAQGASAAPVIGQLMSDQAGARLANAISGGGSQPQGQNTNPTAPAAGNPSQITGQPSQPPMSSVATDNNGAPTLNSIAAETRTNLDGFLSAYPGFRSLLDKDLTPGQAATVQNRMAKFRGAGGGANTVPQSGTGDDEGNANQGTPVGTGVGSPISPAPTSAAGGGSFNDRFGAAYGNPPGVRPTPVGTEAQAGEAETRAKNMRALQAYYAGRNPKAAEAIGARAAEEEKRAHEIRDSLGKYNEPGRVQRDVESGATLKAEQIKSDVERFGKQYDAYQHQADQAHNLLETNKITKSIMDSPSFYSGAGADHVLTMQRFAVALGLKPQDYAMANEVFGKTVSSAILDQIRSLGGQGLGQVRVAEINVMKQAAQNHDNTPASNRLLTEMQDRMAERWTIPIAEHAQQYNGGHLDAGFDRWKSQWINSHPLFSKEELADPRRIAPPLARTPADLPTMGWKDGEPFRTPDGRIFTHAPTSAAPTRPAIAPNPNGA